MFGWGNTANGELGLGAIDEEYVTTPRQITFSKAWEVSQAACGDSHTLFLTNDGLVYACGSNDFGQLALDRPKNYPEKVCGLDAHRIIQVAAGHSHSLAVNEWGEAFSWGSDLYGQLGLHLQDKIVPQPKAIRTLATKQVVQICCGYLHSMALTNNGELYTWGSNSHGQLGLGVIGEAHDLPTQVRSVIGIPIAFIACGGYHSFLVSKSGAVFGWGKNSFGQLGIGNTTDACYPTQLKTMRNANVIYQSCGEDHSVFLTKDGGVFSCGSGAYGQLGHGARSHSELLPRKIMELMGSVVTEIACGRCHTLALEGGKGRLHSFGGLGGRATSNTPQLVRGPWLANERVEEEGEGEDGEITTRKRGGGIKQIFAGGDHCFATVHSQPDALLIDYRKYDPKTQVLTLTSSKIADFVSIQSGELVDQELMRYGETVFGSSSCWNASFLTKNDAHYCCASKNHGVDMDEVNAAFHSLCRVESSVIRELMFHQLTNELIPSLPCSPPDVESLRLYLTLPCFHEFKDPRHYLKLQSLFGKKVLSLKVEAGKVVGIWWSNMSNDYFESLIQIYKDVVVYILDSLPTQNGNEMSNREHGLIVSLDILSKLNRLNRDHGMKVPYDTFYIPQITERVDVRMDYLNWRADTVARPTGKMYFCNYPFVFDASAKTLLLQTDQTIQMQHAMNEAASRAFPLLMFTPVTADVAVALQFLVLTVSRENLVQDTIMQLRNQDTAALKRPLKVKFIGEEAEDAGGVRKEFFMYILREVLDPKYGMFTEDPESRVIWFNAHSFEDPSAYMLIGLLCGLAIYNFTIIDLPFPLVLYKKLLGEPVGLEDLREFSPTVAKNLQELRNYEGDDVEDVFGLRFEITTESFGEMATNELKPNGSNIPVTKDNKDEFVSLYVDYLLNASVKVQFEHFALGFLKVCGGKVLQLFHAQELMALVVGNENYDWDELERNTEYKNEYNKDHHTIRLFWEVFHELPLEHKKKFLLFLTGSDRIPILGMKAVKIIIQPTSDDRYLPVAHTCFNLMDLPKYNTKEKLRYKLYQAMQQTQGFYLV